MSDTSQLISEAQILSYRAVLEGMVAENKQREFCGEAMAFDESNFNSLQMEIENYIQHMKSY